MKLVPKLQSAWTKMPMFLNEEGQQQWKDEHPADGGTLPEVTITGKKPLTETEQRWKGNKTDDEYRQWKQKATSEPNFTEATKTSLNEMGDSWNNFWNYQTKVPYQQATTTGITNQVGADRKPVMKTVTPSSATQEAVMTAAAPALAYGAVTAPVATAASIAGGTLGEHYGNKGGRYLAQQMGLNQNTQDMFGSVAGFGGATLGGSFGYKVGNAAYNVGKAGYNIATDAELRQSVQTAMKSRGVQGNKEAVNSTMNNTGNPVKDMEDFLFSKGQNSGRYLFRDGQVTTGQGISIGANKQGTFGLNLGGGAESPKGVAELKQVMSELPSGSAISGDAHTPTVAARLRQLYDDKNYGTLVKELATKKFDTSGYTYSGQFDGMSPDAMSMLGRMAKDNPEQYHIEYGITPAGRFNGLAKQGGRNYPMYQLQQSYLKGNISAQQFQSQLDPWLEGIGLKPSFLDNSGQVQVGQPFLVRN